MIIKNLTPAEFMYRETRFTSIVKFEGKQIRCHLPNPGRMTELLKKNCRVFIRFAENNRRKTLATLMAVKSGNEIIQLDSNLVAQILPESFRDGNTPGLKGWKVLEREVPFSVSSKKQRLDYLLQSKEREKWFTEVKSTTLVRNKVACFPDAVSKRALQHIHLLESLVKNGSKALLIFVVYRNAKKFETCADIDFDFHNAFMRLVSDSNCKAVAIQAKTEIAHEKNNYSISVKLESTLPIFHLQD